MHEFPDWTKGAVNALQVEKKIILTVSSELVGKSGAFVAFVSCDGAMEGTFVLKVGTVSPYYANEDELHEEVMRDQAFRGKIPIIVAKIRCENVYAFLLEIGGKSRIKWKPLLNTIGLFGSGYSRLIDLLWDDDKVRSTTESAHGLLKQWLDYKLDPNQGRIEKNVLASFGEDISAADSFLCRGVLYPNPLKFVDSHGARLHKIRALYGAFHGDCHAGNVLTQSTTDGEVKDVIIIDFASYRKEGPLFFDGLYFELATLLDQFRGAGEERWIELIEALVHEIPDPSGHQQLEHGWIADISQARVVIKNNIIDRYQNSQDDLRLQFLLAGVAAGLDFMNKVPKKGIEPVGLERKQYLQAFIWSAIFLKRYVSESGTGLPDEARVTPNILKGGGLSLSSDVENLIETLQHSETQGFNILVLGPGFRTSDLRALATTLPFFWKLVIDFGVCPLPIDELRISPISYREYWRTSDSWDVKLLRGGGFWLFANGREDISDAKPADSVVDWRRTHAKALRGVLEDISEKLSPSTVNVFVFSKTLPLELLRLTVETLDSSFSQSLSPLVIVQDEPIGVQLDIDYFCASQDSVLDRFEGRRLPSLGTEQESIQLPQRSASGGAELAYPPTELLNRTRRDLIPLGRTCANTLPPGRKFGVDFRRGRIIEWAELDQHLDVVRTPYYEIYVEKISEALNASNNSTVNLFHEPSAGGTTLGRRLAWDFKEKYPVVVLEQVSEDTSRYLRDLFQWSKLPILVLMDAAIITETAREALFLALREDNTRTVFLWVARIYESNGDTQALPSRLSKEEANAFKDAYLEQVSDHDRARAISELAEDPKLHDQCNPFFFGLAGFGENYVGLERLINSRVSALSQDAQAVLGSLALVSRYSSLGFPLKEFEEIARRVNGGVFSISAPFIIRSKTHIKIPHVLIATKTLEFLARNPNEWKADLHKFGGALLDQIKGLAIQSSDRILQLVQVVFLTRDTVRAIEGDADAVSGGLAGGRRFSPFIRDVGNQVLARTILARIAQIWPAQPHHAVHYARHLLYEDPADVNLAVSVATDAEQRQSGEKDDAVAHTVGMCWRVKLERSLDEAKESQIDFDAISEEVREYFNHAIAGFDRSIVLSKSSNEYGHVSTIQTVAKLIRGASSLSRSKDLSEFLRIPNSRWCVNALALAERHIEILKDKPRLSRQAARAVATWDGVYGNIDAVISQLRQLMRRHEDNEVRAALSKAILAKHKRHWAQMPQGDLQTIVRLADLNSQGAQVQDSDMRMWFRAYRNLRSYDPNIALQRISDWQGINQVSVEPPFYLYVLYFCLWLNGPRRDVALAQQCAKWIDVCKSNRPLGQRGWGYEWLTKGGGELGFTHFSELAFDPVSAILRKEVATQRVMDEKLARLEGTIIRYKGPQQADLDIGHGLSLRFSPLDKVHKDDEGRRASVYVSFGYDGIRGWDVRLTKVVE